MLLSARIEVARNLDDALRAMNSELDTAANPQRLALRSLGVDALGWTRTPYNDEAFKAWTDLLRLSPRDIETIHHLAIMHHARAFDLESSGEPTRSDADWQEAMPLWFQLWKADEFWRRLADIACKGINRDPVDALREEFPRRLLQVHYDIAFDSQTPKHRAKFHLELAGKSPFPTDALADVRHGTYSRVIAAVPKEVWNSDVLDPQIISKGTEAILKYLALDPGCDPALEDALRLEVRLLRAWSTDLAAEGRDSRRRPELLRRIQTTGEPWRPYLDQLIPNAAGRDEDVRHKLALWYRVMGDVLCALDREADAIDYYEKGVSAGVTGEDEQRKCVRQVGQTHAYLARQRAAKGAADAKSFCFKVSQRKDLSVTAYSLLAQGFALVDEFDQAKAMCVKGLQLPADERETDYEAIADHEQALEGLREVERSIEKARKIYEARQLCDRAVSLGHFEQ
jgi:hypothetical protein